MRSWFLIITIFSLLSTGCNIHDKRDPSQIHEEVVQVRPSSDSTAPIVSPQQLVPENTIGTKNHTPQEIVTYARTLMGIPYLFASTDPAKGFDCSGFITYVFNHFQIKVPRSSRDFTNEGKEVDLEDAAPGDLILFTGTDSTSGVVGHMGLIESRRNDSLFFIHSSSGKANGVIISPYEKYYRSRFVKVVRVFPDEYFQ